MPEQFKIRKHARSFVIGSALLSFLFCLGIVIQFQRTDRLMVASYFESGEFLSTLETNLKAAAAHTHSIGEAFDNIRSALAILSQTPDAGTSLGQATQAAVAGSENVHFLDAEIQDSLVSIQRWKETFRLPAAAKRLPVQSPAFLSLVSSASAKTWSAPRYSPAETQLPQSSLGISPFLWVFLLVPLVFFAAGCGMVFSDAVNMRSFGMCTLTAVMGYYLGGGASLLSVGFL